MILNFRQGIVSCQLNGLGQPQFLLASPTPGYVQLSVEPTPTVVAFAHGGSDYLQVFDRNNAAAWGPVSSGVDNYLYWEIDLLTSNVGFGITLLPPVVSSAPPAAPANNQHWFDTVTKQMKVWNAAATAWQVKVRVFAGIVQNGNTSNITPYQPGTQVGLNVASRPGFILMDSQLRPVRSSVGEFLTAESPIHVRTTVGTAGALATPAAGFIYARASENIPGMRFVYFSGPDQVGLASSDLSLPEPRLPIGLSQAPLTNGEVGVITQIGEITHDGWDFSGNIGRRLYCGLSGELTLTRPMSFLAYRVGFVKNARTILLDIDVEPQAVIADVEANTVVQSLAPLVTQYGEPGGIPTYQLSLAAANSTTDGYMPATAFAQLVGHELRITAAEGAIGTLQTTKADVGHLHAIADVINLQASLNALTAVDLTKADKVVGATAGNFAGLDAAGNLTDSGFSSTSFALASHTHSISQVVNLQLTLDSKASRLHLNTFGEIFSTVDRSGATDIPGVGAVSLVDALAAKLSLSGGTMIGPLLLAGNPTAALEAAPKQYVDTFAITVMDEGTPLTTKATQLNFAGAGVTATHMAGITTINVAGAAVSLPGAEDQVLLRGATATDFKVLSTGSAGQVLVSAGAGAPPVWSSAFDVLTILNVSGPYAPSALAEANGRTLHRVSAASATQFTVPNDTTLNNPVGSSYIVSWTGTGQVEIVGQVGVTINSPDTNKIGKRHGKVTIIKVGPNEWDLEGNLEPAP